MPAVIEFQEVTKVFPQKNKGKAAFCALKQVSFNIEQGDFFALLGPNGAGKTTLIQILAGLQKASSGCVRVMGFDVEQHYQKARMSLGIVPQELVFDPFFSVRETLQFQSGYFGIEHNDAWIDELLDALHLADKANANMRQLSGGMKRRVMVAQALVHKPPVIVLDEPTAGVDVELRRQLWDFIRRLNREGHTILLTTHYLEEAQELSNRIAVIKQGQMVTLSDKEALMNSYASKVLRFRTKESLAQVLSPLEVTCSGDWQTVNARDVLEVQSLLNKVSSSAINIDDIHIVPANLEDVFLQIVREDKKIPSLA